MNVKALSAMNEASASEQEETTIVSYSEDLFNQAKSKMLSDFRKAIAEAEELRNAAPDHAGDGAAAVPTIPNETPGCAGATPEDAFRASGEVAAESPATAADRVHDDR